MCSKKEYSWDRTLARLQIGRGSQSWGHCLDPLLRGAISFCRNGTMKHYVSMRLRLLEVTTNKGELFLIVSSRIPSQRELHLLSLKPSTSKRFPRSSYSSLTSLATGELLVEDLITSLWSQCQVDLVSSSFHCTDLCELSETDLCPSYVCGSPNMTQPVSTPGSPQKKKPAGVHCPCTRSCTGGKIKKYLKSTRGKCYIVHTLCRTPPHRWWHWRGLFPHWWWWWHRRFPWLWDNCSDRPWCFGGPRLPYCSHRHGKYAQIRGALWMYSVCCSWIVIIVELICVSSTTKLLLVSCPVSDVYPIPDPIIKILATGCHKTEEWQSSTSRSENGNQPWLWDWGQVCDKCVSLMIILIYVWNTCYNYIHPY